MGTHPIFESDFDCLTVSRMSSSDDSDESENNAEIQYVPRGDYPRRKADRTRRNEFLEQTQSEQTVEEIISIFHSTGDQNCNEHNLAEKVRTVLCKSEFAGIKLERELEQEQLKAMRLQNELFHEQKKQEAQKSASEIGELKRKLEKIKSVTAELASKLSAMGDRETRDVSSQTTVTQQLREHDRNIEEDVGRLLRGKDETNAKLRRENENLRRELGRLSVEGKIPAESPALRRQVVELEHGVVKYFNLSKRLKLERDSARRRLEEIVQSPDFQYMKTIHSIINCSEEQNVS